MREPPEIADTMGTRLRDDTVAAPALEAARGYRAA